MFAIWFTGIFQCITVNPSTNEPFIKWPLTQTTFLPVLCIAFGSYINKTFVFFYERCKIVWVIFTNLQLIDRTYLSALARKNPLNCFCTEQRIREIYFSIYYLKCDPTSKLYISLNDSRLWNWWHFANNWSRPYTGVCLTFYCNICHFCDRN